MIPALPWSPPVTVAISAVWGFIAFATLVGHTLARVRPGAGVAKVNRIIHAWWVMTALFCLALAHRYAMLAFIAGVSFLALREFLALVPARDTDRYARIWSYGAISVQTLAVSQEWFFLFVLYIPLYHFLMGAFRLVLRGETDHYVRASTHLQWGLMLTVFSLSHLAYLMMLPGGAGLVLCVVVLTELNDVAQFLWGKSFGRRKVMPTVSPNKTWAGLVGGVATTTVLSTMMAPHLTPLSTGQAAGFGALLGAVGFIGDVVMSAVKRDRGIKDTSTLIPGHGGVLDRVDSLSYTAPVSFYLLYFGFFA